MRGAMSGAMRDAMRLRVLYGPDGGVDYQPPKGWEKQYSCLPEEVAILAVAEMLTLQVVTGVPGLRAGWAGQILQVHCFEQVAAQLQCLARTVITARRDGCDISRQIESVGYGWISVMRISLVSMGLQRRSPSSMDMSRHLRQLSGQLLRLSDACATRFTELSFETEIIGWSR